MAFENLIGTLMPTDTHCPSSVAGFSFPHNSRVHAVRKIHDEGKEIYRDICRASNTVDKDGNRAGQVARQAASSAVLLALFALPVVLLRLVLPHRDDHVRDQHDVGHDGRRGAREGRVAWWRSIRSAILSAWPTRLVGGGLNSSFVHMYIYAYIYA